MEGKVQVTAADAPVREAADATEKLRQLSKSLDSSRSNGRRPENTEKNQPVGDKG